MERRHTNRPAKVEARQDGKQYITGYGIVFYREGDPSTEYELWDDGDGNRAVERVEPGFADRALLERHDVRGLVNHDPNMLLGRVGAGTVMLTKTADGLRYDILFNENDSDHRNAMERAQRGDYGGSSFAFKAQARWDKLDDGTRVRWLQDSDLFDIGPVTYPAYCGSSAGFRAQGSDLTDVRKELERWESRQGDADSAKRRQLEVETFLMEME